MLGYSTISKKIRKSWAKRRQLESCLSARHIPTPFDEGWLGWPHFNKAPVLPDRTESTSKNPCNQQVYSPLRAWNTSITRFENGCQSTCMKMNTMRMSAMKPRFSMYAVSARYRY